MADPRRALVAASIGNVLEWYDFALYGAFATVLASTYFPSADEQLVPAWYATVVALMAAVGALGLGETAFEPLDADEPAVASESSVAG